MAKKLKDEIDIQVFILYLLKKVGKPLTFNDLTEVVLADGFVDYMAFAECLGKLIDTGAVLLTGKENEESYSITQKGLEVEEELEGKVAAYVRTRSLKSALHFLSFKDRKVRVPVSSTRLEGGQYDMVFSIVEDNRTIFSLQMLVDNEHLEQLMRTAFQTDPERIYRSILSVMSGDTTFS